MGLEDRDYYRDAVSQMGKSYRIDSSPVSKSTSRITPVHDFKAEFNSYRRRSYLLILWRILPWVLVAALSFVVFNNPADVAYIKRILHIDTQYSRIIWR